jgi:quercetin dioxygenase-like cupin family protein
VLSTARRVLVGARVGPVVPEGTLDVGVPSLIHRTIAGCSPRKFENQHNAKPLANGQRLRYEKRVSMAYLAQPEQQQQLEWLDGGTLAILLDGKATDGQLMIGRFDVSEGDAPPYHKHTREDEVFMLIKGTALLWYDDQEMELSEGGIVFLPKNIPHAYRITSQKADLLMINTPAGIEGMFRYAGRDRATPRPEGFEISPESLVEGADKFGQIILGPPR